MFQLILLSIFSVVMFFLLKWFFSPYFSHRNRNQTKTLRYFENGEAMKDLPKPFLVDNLADQSEYDLTLVVPAYNEEERLPVMMKETLEYLQKKIKEEFFKKVEIIIVDDGSKDKTLDIIQKYTESHNTGRNIVVRGLQQVINQGKGAAVKYGSLYSRGQYVLFADADGATDINDLEKIYTKVKNLAETKKQPACAIGCRNSEETKVQRKGIRKLLNWLNTSLVRFVLGFEVLDTQCGFKIFTREAAKIIFPTQHLERWAFDIELIFLCAAKGVAITEVPVTWQEVDGSHLNIVDAGLQMVRDMLLIKFLYTCRLWNYDDFAF